MKLFLLVYLAPFSLLSQGFTSKIEPSEIEIGTPFYILLEMEVEKPFPKKGNLKLSDLFVLRPNLKKNQADTISLDWIGKPKDTIRDIQGKSYIQILAKVMCLDTGIFLFSPDSLLFGQRKFVVQPSVFKVILVATQPQQDIADIKESFTELPELPWSFWSFLLKYGWIIILLGALVAIYFYFKKVKSKIALIKASPITVKEKTLQDLQKLFAEKHWLKHRLNYHFVEAILILKTYLGEECSISMSEKTTFEIKFYCQKNGVGAPDIIEISFLLEVSDLVKFAQSYLENEGVELVNKRMLQFVQNFEMNRYA
jgi:hypothetical protein